MMNNTIKRIEVKRITRVTLDEIDNMAGIYCVHCPITGFTKFGRASKLRDRLQDYATMCLNGGGVVILTKTMSPNMIVCAEKLLLSAATACLNHVDKNEYFMCNDEVNARKLMEDVLAYLSYYYVSAAEILEGVMAGVCDAANSSTNTEDFFATVQQVIDSVRDTGKALKEEDCKQIRCVIDM